MKKNPCVRTSMYLSAALAAGFVITTSQIHAVEILAVDFGTATSPVESGFVGQSATSATHTTTANPLFPALRSGHRLFQRPSHKKQIPSNATPFSPPSGPFPRPPVWPPALSTAFTQKANS